MKSSFRGSAFKGILSLKFSDVGGPSRMQWNSTWQHRLVCIFEPTSVEDHSFVGKDQQIGKDIKKWENSKKNTKKSKSNL